MDQSLGWEVWIVPKGTAVEERANVWYQHYDFGEISSSSFGDVCPETRPEIYFNYVGKFTLMVMDKNGTLVSQNDFRARNGASYEFLIQRHLQNYLVVSKLLVVVIQF